MPTRQEAPPQGTPAGADILTNTRERPPSSLGGVAFPHLAVGEKVADGPGFRVCRAVTDTGESVLVKVLDADHLSEREILRLRHEHAFAEDLQGPETLRPRAFGTLWGRPAYVMAGFSGRPLERLLGAPMDMARFLPLAARLAAAVGALHAQGVMHKDVQPANVLVSDDLGEVRLINLGFASRLPREGGGARVPALVEGTFAFMSPEQAGRMDRAVDYRTDLYSLGVTLYVLLTGQLPFSARDPLEWVHCHVARAPQPPTALAPSCPPIVSDLVLKLLAKAADDRYQSARGLLVDLERCRRQWEREARVDPFVLAQHDVPNQLNLPERLYGRARELAALRSALAQVVASGAPRVVVVSGPTGIGKTSLVSELRADAALFAWGKFDALTRALPYSTVTEALASLVRGVLAESEEGMRLWRKRLQQAVGTTGQLLVDVLPQLEIVIGPQPPVPDLIGEEAKNRFHEVLRRFLGVFARPGQPLVLFLDDLQWADASSLQLLRYLLSHPETHHLLFVGASRTTEGSAPHAAFTGALRVELGPLSVEDLGQLVADTVRCDRLHAAPLARLVHEKTGGNPFFAVQFLLTLHQDGLVRFDPEVEAWRWDLEQIRARGYTENVIDFLVAKLDRLPQATRRVLTLAACLGPSGALDTLAAVVGATIARTEHDLWAALREGLLLRQQERFVFPHDRIRQAAYELVPPADRARTHLRIGRILLARAGHDTCGGDLFEIVSHLNRGAPGMRRPAERVHLAELDLHASRKARAATAYTTAIALLDAGRALLPADSWRAQRDLTFGLELERARCLWLSGHPEQVSTALESLLPRAANITERTECHILAIRIATARSEFARAARICLAACAESFGIDLPLHPTPALLEDVLKRTRAELGDRPIEGLLDLPPMSDADQQSAVALISASLPPAYLSDPLLHDLLCCHIVQVSLRGGNAVASPHGYVTFGAALGRVLHAWDEAWRFGQVGLALVERGGPGTAGKPAARFTEACFIHTWVRPLREVVPLYATALDAGVVAGDLAHACYAAQKLVLSRLVAGDPLGEVAAEAERQLELTRLARFDDLAGSIACILRFAQSLRRGGAFDPGPSDAGPSDAGAGTSYTRVARGLFGTLYGLLDEDYANGVTMAAGAMEAADRLPGMLENAETRVVTALAAAAWHDQAPRERRPELVAVLAACQQLLGACERQCPQTFGCRRALVAAESARLRGEDLLAMRLYDEAVRSARDNGFVQYDALANDMAARFHGSRGFATIADAYLREARSAYARWGAAAKVASIDERFPHLAGAGARESATISTSTDQLDIAAVLRAARAIASDIDLDELVATLLRTVIQGAGAESGCLLLPTGEEPAEDAGDTPLRVEAMACLGSAGLEVVVREGSAGNPPLPESIINYVARSREPVLLEDATRDGTWSRDPYIVRHRPRSVLCMPMVKRTELVGVLYLENYIARGAFTAERLALLQVLAPSAAISLKNARLFAALKRENTQRRAAEAALLSAKDQLRAVIDNTTAIVYMKNPEGRYLLVNNKFGEIFHLPPDGAVGRTDHEIFPTALADEYRANDLAALRRGVPVEAEEVAEQDDGHHTYLSLKFPLFDAEGAPYAVTGISTDITARKAAEAELSRYRDHLEDLVSERTRDLSAANEELEAFSYSVAHDLRAPLRSIEGFGTLLERTGGLEPRAAEYLGRMRAAGRHMGQLVEDLLQLSRVTRTPMARASVDLSALARGVVAELQHAEPERVVDVQIEEGLVAAGDPHLLGLLLQNLLGNAWKFTGRRADAHIELTSTSRDGVPAFRVRDNGAGFDPAYADELFQPFRRLHTASEFPGTGIGLSIARRVVTRHGGHIWAEAPPGGGATFTFTLG